MNLNSISKKHSSIILLCSTAYAVIYKNTKNTKKFIVFHNILISLSK